MTRFILPYVLAALIAAILTISDIRPDILIPPPVTSPVLSAMAEAARHAVPPGDCGPGYDPKGLDIPMMLNAAGTNKLVTANTAAAFAERLFRDNFGDAETNRRLPLVVEDADDRWKITAPFVPTPADLGTDGAHTGAFHVEILKFDGQIHKFGQDLVFAQTPDLLRSPPPSRKDSPGHPTNTP
jgi:hypothetical protein